MEIFGGVIIYLCFCSVKFVRVNITSFKRYFNLLTHRLKIQK